MAVILGHDAIHANISHLPPGQAAGYTTGSPDIKWTAADWAAHKGAVRICQDSGTDHTADVLDVERGAASNTDAAFWVPRAAASYKAVTRAGQRTPAVYTSASNVTPLVNALIGHGIKTGVGLWVANWNLTDAQAVADVQNAAGPFPIVAVQFHSAQFYDTDVFSTTWLGHTSVAGPGKHATQAGDTVTSIAGSRNMKPESWLVLQGRLGADTGELGGGALKAGVEWRTVNP
jgi:hypothetical protein